MELVILIGRIMFGLLFLAAGLGHVTDPKPLVAHAEQRGVPRARPLTVGSGVAIVIGAGSLMLGVYPDLGALILAVFLLTTALVIHRFWAEPEGDARMITQTQFMKDVALAGAALVMFAVFAERGDLLGFTITGPMF